MSVVAGLVVRTAPGAVKGLGGEPMGKAREKGFYYWSYFEFF